MKKIKQLVSWVLAVWTVFSISLPAVMAQEATEMSDLLREIQEANKEIYSMKVDGDFHVEANPVEGEQLLADVKWDGEYNLDPFVGQMNAQLNSTGEDLDAHKEVNAVLDQGTLYYQIDGQEWAAMDVAEYTNSVANQIALAQGRVDNDDYQAIEDSLLEYMEYEETEAEHIFTLKENIDGEQLYDDLDQLGFFDEVYESALEQVEERPEVEGEEQPTPQEVRDVVDSLYSRENFVKFFQANPHYLIAYDKATKQLSRLESDVTLMVDDFVDETEEVPAEDRLHNVRMTLNLRFSHHGEVFNIVVPDGVEVEPAPTVDEVESVEEAEETEADTVEPQEVSPQEDEETADELGETEEVDGEQVEDELGDAEEVDSE